MRWRATLLGLAALGAAFWATGAGAAPVTSRGEQFFPISIQECQGRAAAALAAEGYTAYVYGGGGATFIGASKDQHSAIITCNDARQGVVVNVFVASDPGNPGGVPGNQRQRLQARMGGQIPPPEGPPVTAGSCGWINGNDARAGNDIGRGIQDLTAHRNYVLSSGAGSVPGLIGQRMETLRGCLSQDAYARLYADASVLVAAYGRARLGWIDGQDGRFSGDTGRGVSNWQAHYAHAMSGGAGQAPGLISSRVAQINSGVPLDVAAQLYAELSVLIARYGDGG